MTGAEIWGEAALLASQSRDYHRTQRPTPPADNEQKLERSIQNARNIDEFKPGEVLTALAY
jgi:hypothetical protein